ncbi:MAG: cellulase family glycosylhydrolase [Gammaproteobacteria bacterium]|nr:cellulase family glycosylhydrolase [Gammaproteobacteria bacterium]
MRLKFLMDFLYIMVALMVFVFPLSADGFFFGAGTAAGQGSISDTRAFTFLHHGGFNGFRDEVYWSQVEKAPGNFALPSHLRSLDAMIFGAGDRMIKPLVILNYGNPIYGGGLPQSSEAVAAFCRYAQFVAGRYKGKVKYYEIWNEWNSGMGSWPKEPGSAEAYDRLVRACVPKIKQVDPDVKVLIGSTAGYDRRWTEELLQKGTMAVADGFSVHPYVFEHHADRTPEKAVSFLMSLSSQISIHKKPVEIIVSEIGWPTSTDAYGIPEDLQASYMSRFLLYAKAIPGVKGISVHCLVDAGDNPANREHRFGLVRRDLSPKPSLAAINSIADVLKHGSAVEMSSPESDIRYLKFVMPNSEEVVALWSNSPTPVTIGTKTSGVKKDVLAQQSSVLSENMSHRVEVGPAPLLIRGKLGAISVSLSGIEAIGSPPMPPKIVSVKE